MKKLFTFVFAFVLSLNLFAQIYAPEGIHMPGMWNGWANPASGNLSLTSSSSPSQPATCSTGMSAPANSTTYKTLLAGTGAATEFAFASGPSSNAWANKWVNVNVSLNSIQNYSWQGGPNNNITLAAGKYYTMNFNDGGYANNKAIFMETSAAPRLIVGVSGPTGTTNTNSQTVTITLSGTPSAEEKVFLSYTTDNFATRTNLEATCAGAACSATIPSQVDMTNVKYFAFTSTLAAPATTEPDASLAWITTSGGTCPVAIAYQVLPITLNTFTAKNINKSIQLDWTTETESNASHFEVEKSTNGTAWSKMKEVKAFGNSIRRQDYNFTDETPNKGINYYRLKMVDRDGSFEYSKVVSANFNGGGKVNIFPNPAQDVLSITLSNDVNEATVEIFNTNGQVQMRNVLNDNQLNISELATGLYFIQVSDENGQVISREKLMKK